MRLAALNRLKILRRKLHFFKGDTAQNALGLDSNCDVHINAAMPGNEPAKAAITNMRHRLLAEYTGVNTEVLAEMFDSCAMMREAVLMQLSLMH